MICPKCGTEVNDGAKYCPNCGANMDQDAFENRAAATFETITTAASEQVQNVIDDVRDGLDGEFNGAGPLETNRSLVMYILLTIVTCGIYSFFFIYSMARDVNIACEGDGQKTRGLIQYLILSFITCGIYPLIWEYSLANRLAEGSERYGMRFAENGTTILMWHIFGMVICGIGPFIAMNILIKNTNRICDAYNIANGYY